MLIALTGGRLVTWVVARLNRGAEAVGSDSESTIIGSYRLTVAHAWARARFHVFLAGDRQTAPQLMTGGIAKSSFSHSIVESADDLRRSAGA